MIAEIISVGTELLMGQIVDTNSQYISSKLSEMGIDVFYKSTVGDNPQRLRDTLKTALGRSDVIITTGGIGPTEDDITKETMAELMGFELYMHSESLQKIESYFEKNHKVMAEINKKQALMPKGGIVMPNPRGTAPGCIMSQKGKFAVVLPGPPFEMRHMFDQYVVPFLEDKCDDIIYSRYLKICGMGESDVAQNLSELIHNQTNPTLATYASPGEVQLRITAKCKKGEDPIPIVEPVVQQVKEILGNVVYAEDNINLDELVAKTLINQGKTLAVAESCTGGMLSSRLVDYPGCSKFLIEGIVSYSNFAKQKHLGVPKEMLDEYGAVSEEVAGAMASGVRKDAGADYGIGITGIAGPDGGTEEKPVGLVYIGIADENGCEVHRYLYSYDRKRIRERTVKTALNLLRLKLMN